MVAVDVMCGKIVYDEFVDDASRTKVKFIEKSI